jgi:hypothetical protein
MSTITRPRAARQVTRTIRLDLAPFGGNPGICTISVTTGVKVKRTLTVDYFLRVLKADFGAAAFELEKFSTQTGDDEEPGPYQILLDGPNSTCSCKGFLRHGMAANGGTGCKHIGGVQALVNAGKLPGASAPAVQAGAA